MSTEYPLYKSDKIYISILASDSEYRICVGENKIVSDPLNLTQVMNMIIWLEAVKRGLEG